MFGSREEFDYLECSNCGCLQIIDVPASYHNGACGFSFSDGHSEIHKWRGSRIKVPVRNGNPVLPLPLGAAGDSLVDVLWMCANTTVSVKDGTYP